MSPKENQTGPELQNQAVQIELPADLLTQLQEVKAQANILTAGDPNWLEKQVQSIAIPKIPAARPMYDMMLERYNLFVQVCKNNPDWWKYWQDKVELRKHGIYFKEEDFEIDCDDTFSGIAVDLTSVFEPNTIDFEQKVPDKKQFEVLARFISSSKSVEDIKDFLGIVGDLYRSRRENTVMLIHFNFKFGISVPIDNNAKAYLRFKK